MRTAEEDMSIAAVNPASYSDMAYSGVSIKGGSDTPSEPSSKAAGSGNDTGSFTSYSIGYDRVSKEVYDKYDTDGDGKISKKELDAYQAEKSGAASETDESSETAAQSANSSFSGVLGTNIDIFA